MFFVGSFPCGQITVKKEARKKKREATSFGDMFDASNNYDEIELIFDDSLSNQNVTHDQNFTTQSPSLHSQGEALPDTPHTNSNSKTEKDPDVRIVGGYECRPGECPWQVNECAMYLVAPAD